MSRKDYIFGRVLISLENSDDFLARDLTKQDLLDLKKVIEDALGDA